MQSGALKFDWELRVDALTAVMLVVITTVSALVHLYSWSYMEETPGSAALLRSFSLFTFAMLMLVTANNLSSSRCSWLGRRWSRILSADRFLVQRNPAPRRKAAIKAFVVNRVGDL